MAARCGARPRPGRESVDVTLAKYQNMSQSFWLDMASSASYIYFLVRSCQYCFDAESVCLYPDSIYISGLLKVGIS
jgi:hypothetical protein